MAKTRYPKSYAHPRYWPTWFTIGAMHIMAWLPTRWRTGLGRALGWLAWHLAKRRRHITETNIRLVFPDLSPKAQHQLAYESFIQNGISLPETAVAWCRDIEFLRAKTTFKGLEHVDKALQEGRGALLMGAHYAVLDLSAALVNLERTVDSTYRPHDNPLFNDFMMKGRARSLEEALDKNNLRRVLTRLKQNKLVWYAPDQDYGRKVSVFAPFFGQPAASIKMTARIAKMTGTACIPLRVHRKPDNEHYEIEFYPPLSDFPTGDEVADARQVNAALELMIGQAPAQYMWMHRRFKTRPEGEAGVY